MRFTLFAVLVAGALSAASAAPVNRQELKAAATTTTDKTATLEKAVAVEQEPILLEKKQQAVVATKEEAVLTETKEEAVVLEKKKAETIPAPEPTCVNNATHCSCLGQVYYPIILIPDTAPPVCYQDPLANKAYKCDCAGTALCMIEEFPCTKLQPLQDVVPNQKFYCEPTESECKKLTRVFSPIVYEEQKESKTLEAAPVEQRVEKLSAPVEQVSLQKKV
eukprot:CAMPEP_0185843998 /NCGR_PEP_ID=MMETSP1354-20130828/327_1 /TAXON_ID=708628 /ORGANISM="Erythrolobus madagascarensis, Strain CCMP3276" /LENGTH=220 /DNA_ID=CAMNT_0028543601 /DNA_START=54 /DNA_END=716 /DNA_ORIENTATION=+